MKTCSLLAIALTLLVPAGEPAGDASDIQGSWRVLLLQDSGETVPIGKDSRLVIAKDQLTLKDKNYPLTVTLRLDPTKNPKWVDVVTTQSFFPGIYELKGDSLRICYHERTKGERPTVFGSMANSPSDVLLILQRDRR